MITFLKQKQIKDIIKQEKNGNYYSFSDLISEIDDYIDQKTKDKLNEINQAERRWIAHHKTGESLEEELIAIRARLYVFLNELF